MITEIVRNGVIAVTVDLPMDVFDAKDRDAIKKCFDDLHAQRYGTSVPDEKAEMSACDPR